MDKNINISPTSPIGIFDSGVGGLSVWKEIRKHLPNESTIYLADSKNAPYGGKSKEKIIEFGIKNTELLLALGCKIIVVACNTATTNSIDILRKKYTIPFIGIEPATKPAALTSKTGKIGILATHGTLKSNLFLATSNQFRSHVEIIETEGKNLVKLIEAGKINETKNLLQQYLLPMVEEDIDHLVLGCTHYPFLTPIIKKIIPDTIKIIDSGEAVAKQTKRVLEKKEISTSNNFNGKDLFYTNGNLTIFQSFLNQMKITTSIAQQLHF